VRFFRFVLTVFPLLIGGAVLIGAEIPLAKALIVSGGLSESVSFKRRVIRAAGTFFDAGVMTGNAALSLFDREPLQPDSCLPSIQIHVVPGSFDAMAAHLPKSAKARYYRGEILYPDGVWRRMQYRFRGRSIWHWDPEKPSLRIKLRKADPIEGQRHLNLVNPEDRAMIANPLGEWLADALGVLTPRTKMVRLFVNGAFAGVYQLTTREDQRWLRAQRRLPGPLYVGRSLRLPWRAGDFERIAEEELPEGFDPISEMLAALETPLSVKRYDRLWGIVSMEGLARWSAAMTGVGSPHTDAHHNHLYYFDRAAGRLEPAVADINGYGMLLQPVGWGRLTGPHAPDHRLPLTARLQPLLDAAFRDPRFTHRRNEILYEALQGAGSVERQQAMARELWSRIDADAKADRSKGAIQQLSVGWFRVPYGNRQYEKSKRQMLDWIERRHRFLLERLEGAELRVLLWPMAGGRTGCRIEVGGDPGVRLDPDEWSAEIHRGFGGGEGSPEPLKGPLLLLPALEEDRDFSYRWTESADGERTPPYYLRPAPQAYEFSAEGNPAIWADRLNGAFTQGLTGRPVVPEIRLLEAAPPVESTASLHPWLFPEPPDGEVALGPGIVELRSDLRIAPTQRLVVRPGTRLRLGPGVSIVSGGPVEMSGTEKAPITVERLDPAEPWGVLALQGPDSAGSRIARAEITGGSRARVDRVGYSGMVSVYHSDDFRLEKSRLGGNLLSDDTLHLVHTRAEITETDFFDCYGDCVDYDYSDGPIREVTVTGAGNDGLDFMASRVTLSGARVHRAGDKGFSCGEGSRIEAEDFEIDGASIGVAVKDRSEVLLRSGFLRGNRSGVLVYAKNPAYGGPGTVSFSGVGFSGNSVDLNVEPGGAAWAVGQPLPEKRAGEGRMEEKAAP